MGHLSYLSALAVLGPQYMLDSTRKCSSTLSLFLLESTADNPPTSTGGMLSSQEENRQYLPSYSETP